MLIRLVHINVGIISVIISECDLPAYVDCVLLAVHFVHFPTHSYTL